MLASILQSSVVPAAHAQERSEALVIDSVVLRPLVEAEVPARRIGVLATIAVEEGATVAADELLASLDPRAAKLAVAQAELEREQAQAKAANELRIQYADKALEVAQAELKRSSESIEQFAKSISQSQIDVERLTVEKLQLERQQAVQDLALEKFELRLKENAAEAARLDLELHVVRAPFAGVVSLVRGRAGEWVEPGTPVLRLVAIDSLRAEGFAPADAVTAARVGAKVRFLPAAALTGAAAGPPAAPMEGVLRFVSPEIDPVSRQVRVWAEIANPDRRLRPGQQGRLELPAS